jgi:NAD(P)-dependent dehydrogenase (short-subunit alcohol dehydrogenase family)
VVAEDRAAIVVGGAGGIGSAISRRLAAEGYRVTVADRDIAHAQELAASLDGEGHSATDIDIIDQASVDAAFEAVEASGPAAVLAIASGGPLTDLSKHPTVATLSPADWRATVEYNLTAVFLVIQKFAQLRTARRLEHSRIVTISSTSGQVAQSVIDIAYASSKAGIFGMSRQAAHDLAGVGVTVNTIAAGVVGTPAFMRNTGPDVRAGAAAGTLLKRLATPEEIAAGVAYLCSRDAAYITGTILDINGGSYQN